MTDRLDRMISQKKHRTRYYRNGKDFLEKLGQVLAFNFNSYHRLNAPMLDQNSFSMIYINRNPKGTLEKLLQHNDITDLDEQLNKVNFCEGNSLEEFLYELGKRLSEEKQ